MIAVTHKSVRTAVRGGLVGVGALALAAALEAAMLTSTADCPSRPRCRASGRNLHSHCDSATGRSGCGSLMPKSATSLTRALR